MKSRPRAMMPRPSNYDVNVSCSSPMMPASIPPEDVFPSIKAAIDGDYEALDAWKAKLKADGKWASEDNAHYLTIWMLMQHMETYAKDVEQAGGRRAYVYQSLAK